MPRKINRLLLLLIGTAIAACSSQSERGSSGLETEAEVIPSTVQTPPPEPEAVQYTEADLDVGDLGAVDQSDETLSFAEEDTGAGETGVSDPVEYAEEFPITTYELPPDDEIGDLGAVDQSDETLSFAEENVGNTGTGVSAADEFVFEEDVEVEDLGMVDQSADSLVFPEENLANSGTGVSAADEFVIEEDVEVEDLGMVDQSADSLVFPEENLPNSGTGVSAADEFVIEEDVEVEDLGMVDQSSETLSFSEESVYQSESVGDTTTYQSVTVNAEASPLFAFDNADVQANEQAKLESFVSGLSGAEYETVWVVGHADRVGSVQYNQGLSERRANSVQAFLVNLGVDRTRVSAQGRSNLQPVTTENECRGMRGKALIECYQPDRRVEVSVSAEVVKEVMN